MDCQTNGYEDLFDVTDTELIQETLSGNDQAFKTIVQRYESIVARTIYGMLGNVVEVEDIGQEVFIRFYQGLKNFRGDSKVGTYLTRIAINLSLNELKSRKRKVKLFHRNFSVNEMEFIDEDSENRFDNYDKEIIREAIQKLEPEFRSVIILRLMNGYSAAETAQILKCPIGTVLSRLARAQKKLRAILSPYFGENDEEK